ncbi:MAG: glycoside hydrolase family 3 C-terminal domain-containing protein [Clostridia bacterium]|nr:glycoside hydrolase family 3 C-terminal domain-containing protein [Clostridia bacterium]
MNKITALLLSLVLLCVSFSFAANAFTVSDGSDISYAAASESMVLLKNDNDALPLKNTDKIAIFGEGQVFTDGRTGGFIFMGQGSGSFRFDGTIKNPCDVLASYVDNGKLGGVYTTLSASYKNVAATGSDFSYSPTDAEYTAAAAYADKAVYIINRVAHEGADADESLFELTSKEQSELTKLCSAFGNKSVIVAVNNGVALNMGFAKGRVAGIDVDAVIAVPYMGICGVDVFCETLVGDINPSGKSTDTYAKKLTDYPSYKGFYENAYYSHYYEDIYVGYRYFETFNVDVDYEFGYGLSYTTFDISDVTYSEDGGNISVTAKVTNTGDVSGKEVVQLYFGAPQKGTNGAVLSKASKELSGFAKTSLLVPGASETVSITFDIDTMASYDDLGTTGKKSAYVMEAGDYTVYVGNSVKNTVVAGVHTEETLRVTEQLSTLCEPFMVFDRMTFDGSEKVGVDSKRNTSILHTPEVATMTYPSEPIQFSEVVNGNATVEEFLSQMSNFELCTLAGMEKALLVGSWGGSEEVQEKYGIARADTTDGPQGIKPSTICTGIPSASALACTWNLDLLANLGDMIGREALISDTDVWLSPGVNIHRFPLCGRNFEYFSEDPYLTGAMAAVIIKNVEKNGVPCSIKHFVANEREYYRSTMDCRVSERALREIYLLPFEMGVEAGVSTVMTSYNKLNGKETAESAELIRGILRGEWGFDGLVTTDWSNDSNLKNEVIAGNNVHSSVNFEHQAKRYEQLVAAVKDGSVSRSLLIENSTYVINLLLKTPAARTLANPEVCVVKASGESKFEAEDYSNKHNFPRFEQISSGTAMSYTRFEEGYTPWLEYTLDVEEAGSYILHVNMSNGSTTYNGNALRVFVNGEEQQMTYQAANTGSWTTYTVKEVGRVDLPKGKVTLKIKCNDNANCGNFDYFTLTPITECYIAISTADELVALMSDSTKWSGKYYLTNDIDLTGKAQYPIGTYATNFKGIFDGMGHSIKGINLSTSSERDFGLFGKIAYAVIRDLKVYGEVSSTYPNAVVGGIVGTVDYGAIVSECENYCTVTHDNSTRSAKGVGGISGYIYSGGVKQGSIVKNCINNGAVTSETHGNSATVGGITGALQNDGAGASYVTHCINNGTVYGGGVSVGGIVGYMGQAKATGGANRVEYCLNNAAVTGAKGRVGGIVGFSYSKCETVANSNLIEFCINNGAVHSGTGYEVGGIVGINVAIVNECVNFGKVSAEDTKEVAGVIGRNASLVTAMQYTITNSYTIAYTPIAVNLEANYTITNCAIASESDIATGQTSLTYGEGGFVYLGGKLSLAKVNGIPSRYDVNGDGSISVYDALQVLKAMVNHCGIPNRFVADINGDGELTLMDALAHFKSLV